MVTKLREWRRIFGEQLRVLRMERVLTNLSGTADELVSFLGVPSSVATRPAAGHGGSHREAVLTAIRGTECWHNCDSANTALAVRAHPTISALLHRFYAADQAELERVSRLSSAEAAAAARSELPRVSARPALTRASPHSTSSEDGEEPAAREGSGGRARARGRNRSGRGRSPEPTEPERAHPPLLVEHPEPRCESLIKQSARITSLVEP